VYRLHIHVLEANHSSTCVSQKAQGVFHMATDIIGK